MCLFPGMFTGGNNDPNRHIPPLAKKHQCNLYILTLVHLTLAIMMTVAYPGSGIPEIFVAMILACVAYSMNFCLVIFYMIFMI